MKERFDDVRVRTVVFEWLAAQVAQHGDVLPRAILVTGLELDGRRIPLLGPEGIFKPQVLVEIPLSITTVPSGPYADTFGPDNLLRYKYRGRDAAHPDNRGLRVAMQRRVPLVYFHRIVPGKYLAVWPVFVVGDDPASLTFTVAVDDMAHASETLFTGPPGPLVGDIADEVRREYVTATVKQRLHQRLFRERVVQAYQQQCALCRLRHDELLDAAHIVPDSEPMGEPTVTNGIALCKLHHAAFDRYFLGIRPNYVVEIRGDILRESDGPTLVYSIQRLHGSRIFVPRQVYLRPSKELLEIRFERFLRSG